MDPVIVAGAGPTGLALTLCLVRHEVPVILLDEHDAAAEPDRPERTAVLRPATADLLHRLGYTAVRADATRWTAWRTLRRRQEVEHVVFDENAAPGPAPDPASEERPGGPSPLHLPQDRLRRGLLAALAGNDLVTVVHGRLDTVEQDARGVGVRVRRHGDVPETWLRGAYLAGCDGPRSTVRKLLDIRFPGRTTVDRHAVTALRVALPDPGTALLHRDPPGARGSEVTARPLHAGTWRFDWTLRPDGPPLTADSLVDRIRAVLGGWCDGTVPPYELLGSADHPVHQRLARRWRSGRAFLAGDAAHLLGVLGTQGLEEGLRDAENLAWKLALAWHHGASELLLDSYEAERRGAVGDRLRAADQALPLLRGGTSWHTLLSGRAARHAHLLADGHLGRGRLGGPPSYERSPLTPPPARGARTPASPATPLGTAPGRLTDDVPVIDVRGGRARLRDRLGRDLLVVLVAPGTGVWESRHWLTAGLMPPLSAAVAALPAPAELLITESYPGATAHTVLLVRPDGHLVGTMTGCRPAELHALADQTRGGPTPPPPDNAPPTTVPSANGAPRAGGEW